MTEERTARNGEENIEETITEPTTKQGAKLLIAQLKDLANCIEFFAEDQRLEKIEINSEIFELERQGEIAPYILWQQSRQATQEIKSNREQFEKVKNTISEIKQEWEISEDEVEAVGPWQDSIDNYRSRVDLTYGALYDYINGKRNNQA